MKNFLTEGKQSKVKAVVIFFVSDGNQSIVIKWKSSKEVARKNVQQEANTRDKITSKQEVHLVYLGSAKRQNQLLHSPLYSHG